MKKRLVRMAKGPRVGATRPGSERTIGSIRVVVQGADALVEVVQDNGELFSYDVPAKPFQFPATSAARAAREAGAATA